MATLAATLAAGAAAGGGSAARRPARMARPRQGAARCAAAPRRPPRIAARTRARPLARAPARAAAGASAEGGEEEAIAPAPAVGDTSLLGRTRSFVADNKLPLIVFLWYFINVVFNIKNKALYNYFPCPAFVSALHLAVGSLWGIVGWLAFPKGNAVFPQRQIMPRKLLLGRNFQLQAMFHGLGHTAVNFSFGAVAVSFTHTVKAMEPFVAAAISQLVFRKKVALPVWLSLVPVVAGVALASAHELSFNWVGFNGAMFSNVAFAFRNYLAKEGLSKELNSTNQYIHLSIVSLLWCIPPIFMLEATKLWPAMQAAAASHGTIPFLGDLFFVGLTYHLYNQLCFNAIEAFDKPLTASVGNVAKRCFVIGFSILYFGNAITPQTAAGTIIAIAGVFLYSMSSAREKQKRAAAEAKAA